MDLKKGRYHLSLCIFRRNWVLLKESGCGKRRLTAEGATGDVKQCSGTTWPYHSKGKPSTILYS